MTNKRHYTFTEIKRLCEYIIGDVRDAQFTPTLIVGIERGGLIPAVYISHQMNLPFKSFRWSTRDFESREPIEKLKEYIDAGEKLLIVDDIVDSGTTFAEIASALGSKNGVMFASTIEKAISTYKPDFSGTILDNPDWIVFPWEHRS